MRRVRLSLAAKAPASARPLSPFSLQLRAHPGLGPDLVAHTQPGGPDSEQARGAHTEPNPNTHTYAPRAEGPQRRAQTAPSRRRRNARPCSHQEGSEVTRGRGQGHPAAERGGNGAPHRGAGNGRRRGAGASGITRELLFPGAQSAGPTAAGPRLGRARRVPSRGSGVRKSAASPAPTRLTLGDSAPGAARPAWRDPAPEARTERRGSGGDLEGSGPGASSAGGRAGGLQRRGRREQAAPIPLRAALAASLQPGLRRGCGSRAGRAAAPPVLTCPPASPRMAPAAGAAGCARAAQRRSGGRGRGWLEQPARGKDRLAAGGARGAWGSAETERKRK